MSLALELLDRRNKAFGAQSQMCESSNAAELCAFLQQEYEDYDDARYDESGCDNEFVDCYVRRLNDVVKVGRIGYSGRTQGRDESPADAVELNILIEKSLLEYELRLAEKMPRGDSGKSTEGNRKKLVFDVERLGEVLSGAGDNGNDSDLALLRHYVELLKLGYAPELAANRNGGGQNASENTLMDELVSTLLSLAVQRNVSLPPLDTKAAESMDGRIGWFKECIYKVAGAAEGPRDRDQDSGAASASRSAAGDDDENYRALRDLQFAHTYLTKKYEEEVSQHGQAMNSMVAKYQQCEDLLKQSNFELSKVSNQLLRLELQNAELTKKLDARTKDAHELQLKNNLLRVDYLGLAPATTPPASADSAEAPADSLSLSLPSPASSASSATMPSSSVSVRILRMEFKKLVEQMNARFARELETEQTEKRRLEELVELHRQRGAER